MGEDKLIVSVQLENAWMYETGVSETGAFEKADATTSEDFWIEILSKAIALSHVYLIPEIQPGYRLCPRKQDTEKACPPGKGYPSLEPLARALARFMVKEVRYKNVPLSMHIIYTGPPATKYPDTLSPYTTVMKETVKYL